MICLMCDIVDTKEFDLFGVRKWVLVWKNASFGVKEWVFRCGGISFLRVKELLFWCEIMPCLCEGMTFWCEGMTFRYERRASRCAGIPFGCEIVPFWCAGMTFRFEGVTFLVWKNEKRRNETGNLMTVALERAPHRRPTWCHNGTYHLPRVPIP